MTQFRFGPYGDTTGYPGVGGEFLDSRILNPTSFDIAWTQKGNAMVGLTVVQDQSSLPVIQLGGGDGLWSADQNTSIAPNVAASMIRGVFGLPERMPGNEYRCIYQLGSFYRPGSDVMVPAGTAVKEETRGPGYYDFQVPLPHGVGSLLGVYSRGNEDFVFNLGFIVEVGDTFNHSVTVDLVNGRVVFSQIDPIVLYPGDTVCWTLGAGSKSCTFEDILIYEDSDKQSLVGGWNRSLLASEKNPWDIFPPQHYALGYAEDFRQMYLLNHQTEFQSGTTEESHWYSMTIRDADGSLHTSDPQLIDRPSGG